MKTTIGQAGRRVARASFTLIELLVVVTIILILAGITLKVMSVVNRKAGQAKTMKILEQVKNALGAYYTTYGTYPPVQSVGFEHEYRPPHGVGAPTNLGYSTGLVYYLTSGSGCVKPHNVDPAVGRWEHYLEGIIDGDTSLVTNQQQWAWTNYTHSIQDAWGQGLQYESFDPYQKFKLWSIGPNGTNDLGGGDDIGVTSED